MNVRTRLRTLILVTLVPVVGFAMIGTGVLVQREKADLEHNLRDRARSLLAAVESEMKVSIAALQVLAQAPSLRAGDLDRFRFDAQRALQARGPAWINLLVSDGTTAQMLLNMRVAPGEPLQLPADAPTLLQAARTGQPAIGQIVQGAVLKRRVFAVRVPVLLPDGTRRVLSAVVDPETIHRIIERERFPADWSVAVIDGNLRFVWRRSPGAAGETVGESLRVALQSPQERWTTGQRADGTEVYRVVERSSISDWTVALAIPTRSVEESLRFVWMLWAGFGAVLAGGLWIAWRMADKLSRPIVALAAAAPALGRAQPLQLPDPGPVDELRQLYAAIDQAAATLSERQQRQAAAEEALRAADRAKDVFLAMLGHELRNPLASVSNAAQMLQRAPRRSDVVEQVGAILTRQVGRMSRLVDDLLDASRVTGGKIGLERAVIDLGDCTRQLVDAWRQAGRLQQHRLEVETTAAWVDADRVRIEQVVGNLLDNALKYTPAGGRIGISVGCDGDEAVLTVADDGRGMDADLIGRVFDLFVQGDRAPARSDGGLGIGLTLARRLVELHGGRIAAASGGAGQGSRFSVRLPRVAAPQASAAAPGAAATTAARRVLVVEDNADVRESLLALLAVMGHDAYGSATGIDGVDRAAALRPDLVLVDIGLPDIDGFEVARRLRGADDTRSLHLVALTGYGTPQDRRRASAAGFDDHIAKPVDEAQLQALLARPGQHDGSAGAGADGDRASGGMPAAPGHA